ncbi:sirohydrochlorin chelatase [Paenibacillaceae bacterium WGS1546]|uniref:sirohydrochlorin chelatase n=1 Tax=Cohnella sp. WGS1546 TaxID=3366810 RepID=UPI00372CFFC5
MRPGLLVISHGSREAEWVALVDETMRVVRERLGASLLVETAFLELVDERLIQDGIDRLAAAGATHLLALPLFVSSGSTHADEIGWALGALAEPAADTELQPFETRGLRIDYGRPMGNDPEVADIVLQRLRDMSERPEDEIVLLIGHGSAEAGFREAWERELAELAGQAKSLGGYRESSYALLLPDQVGRELDRLRDRCALGPFRILVQAMFLSEGYFTNAVVTKRLAEYGRGLPIRYDGRALMPHPNVAAWIVRQAGEWLAAKEREFAPI